jgi:hypothetical protein
MMKLVLGILIGAFERLEGKQVLFHVSLHPSTASSNARQAYLRTAANDASVRSGGSSRHPYRLVATGRIKPAAAGKITSQILLH